MSNGAIVAVVALALTVAGLVGVLCVLGWQWAKRVKEVYGTKARLDRIGLQLEVTTKEFLELRTRSETQIADLKSDAEKLRTRANEVAAMIQEIANENPEAAARLVPIVDGVVADIEQLFRRKPATD